MRKTEERTNASAVVARRAAVVAPGVGQFAGDTTAARAAGARIVDVDGDEWIDLAGGIGVIGRTALCMTLTSKVGYKLNCGPYAPEVYRIPYPNRFRYGRGLDEAAFVAHELQRLEETLVHTVAAEHVAAVIIEPVQGEGGFARQFHAKSALGVRQEIPAQALYVVVARFLLAASATHVGARYHDISVKSAVLPLAEYLSTPRTNRQNSRQATTGTIMPTAVVQAWTSMGSKGRRGA